MRRGLRLIPLLLAATACGLLLSPAATWGAVRLGPDTSAAPDGLTGCGGDACTFVNRSAPDLVFAAPFDGVLVRWSIRTATSTQSWRLRTVREVAPGMFIATGSGSPESVAPDAERTFAARLPIRAGDLIAVDGPGSALAPLTFNGAGGSNNRFNPPLLEGAAARSPSAGGGGFVGMYSAQLEPDADRDGFGDETQDRCPTDAGTQGPCGICRGARATLAGTEGRDVLRGTGEADVIVAFGGRDQITALGGNDIVCGGAGKDAIAGGGGRDVLVGDEGRDRLSGGKGRDKLLGGKGRDSLFGGKGRDKLSGGKGRDKLSQD